MSKQRGNSEGTIRKRPDGRWEARLVLESGQRKSLYGKTRQEVARLLANAIRDREQGLTVTGERQTLTQFLSLWLEKTKHEVQPSSYIKYERVARDNLIPTLGDIQLSKLTPQHVQNLYARLLSLGKSAWMVNYTHIILHSALDSALRLGAVQRNVADMVDVPRQHRREMTPLTEEQAKKLLEAARGTTYEALFVLALATGMRRGELLALKWCDVHLEQGFLQVKTNLQTAERGFTIASPKTKHSRRRIALSPSVLDALTHHKQRQDEERRRLGVAWVDLDLVFPTPVGQWHDPSNFMRNHFKPLLKRAGLPSIRFHDLRHTAATLLLGRGINPKVVSEMLGHSNVSITLNLYGHVLPHMQQQAADTMDKLLWG